MQLAPSRVLALQALSRSGALRGAIGNPAKSRKIQIEAMSVDPSTATVGYGARDVAKLLACSVQRRVLGQHEASLLRHYHAALVDRLSAEQAAAYTFDVFQDHFDVSVADFVRFMAGWGWWGDVAWANRKTEAVLDRLAAEV